MMSRDDLLPLLANHVLACGLAGASLRPLAKAAGTSDRMLLYHFGSKEKLLADLLAWLARSYSGLLDSALAAEPAATRQELLQRVLTLGQQPTAAPYQTLWWEIVAGSARQTPGYRAAAAAVMDHLLTWLEAQMPPGDPDPAGGARYLLTLIEGAQMLGAVGHETTALAALAQAVPHS
jgi:AcrR family transcriptional regulator